MEPISRVINFNGLRKLQEEAKQKGLQFGDYCEGILINKGYTRNSCFGWEKMLVLKEFGLNPDMECIPTEQVEQIEYKEVRRKETDGFGNSTGKYQIDRIPTNTGKQVRVPSRSWLNYIKWKKEQLEIELARDANLENIIQEYNL